MPKFVKVGDRYRVKYTAFLRKSGVRCSNPYSSHNTRVWPGEIGTVTLSQWTCPDGSPNSALFLDFDSGRRIGLECVYKPEESLEKLGYWPPNPDDFIRVRLSLDTETRD